MIRFIIAAILFVSAAMGLDMLSGREADMYGTRTITYCILYTLEELLEMVAVIIFIHALLDYIEAEIGTIQIHVSNKED
jgi:hypothetical protein